jgi:hypothetical protein
VPVQAAGALANRFRGATVFASRESILTERQLHLVWRLGWFRHRGLLLEDGRPLDILFPGHPAGGGGPDFREARLRIAGAEVAGDVELHLTPSGWRRHGHGSDSGYAGVVLHVALHREAFGDRNAARDRAPSAELVLEPQLELSVAELASWTDGGPQVPEGEGSEVLARLEELGRSRFDRRRAAFARAAAACGFEEALYRGLMTALGYRLNKAPFSELARLVPRAATRGASAGDLERRYGAAAAGLPWRTAGVRPANHPARRLAGWVRLVAATPGTLGGLDGDSIVERSGGLIGRDRAAAMVASILLPARNDWAGFVRLPPGPPDRPAREAALALGLDPAGLSTLPRRWGALEWRRGPAGNSPLNRLAPV